MGALSKLDETLPNPPVRTSSVAVPGTSRNIDFINWKPTRDRSLCDPCPKARFSCHHFVNLNGSELEETHHMVTGVLKEISFCSPASSSGKQTNARSTSQPYFHSKNTQATTEEDQILFRPSTIGDKQQFCQFQLNF